MWALFEATCGAGLPVYSDGLEKGLCYGDCANAYGNQNDQQCADGFVGVKGPIGWLQTPEGGPPLDSSCLEWTYRWTDRLHVGTATWDGARSGSSTGGFA